MKCKYSQSSKVYGVGERLICREFHFSCILINQEIKWGLVSWLRAAGQRIKEFWELHLISHFCGWYVWDLVLLKPHQSQLLYFRPFSFFTLLNCREVELPYRGAMLEIDWSLFKAELTPLMMFLVLIWMWEQKWVSECCLYSF
jgi:hypothetical protein